VTAAEPVARLGIFLSNFRRAVRHNNRAVSRPAHQQSIHNTVRSIPMAKFLFIYRNDPEAAGKLSPEEMQKYMEKWRAWIGAALQKGWMIDSGDALTPEGRVVGAKTVKDGPFVESKELVGGFSIVEADSIEAAAKLGKGCPGIEAGGTVEVRPLAGYAMKC
jgi:hypothetical protein